MKERITGLLQLLKIEHRDWIANMSVEKYETEGEEVFSEWLETQLRENYMWQT